MERKQNDYFKLDIHEAIYTEQCIEDFKGNPLIEALPPILTEMDVIEKLSTYPIYNEKELELDARYRFHCVQRLKRYFQPLPVHLELEEKFSRAIRQGYLARNPLHRNHVKALNEGHHLIQSGEYILNYQSSMKTSSYGFSFIGISGMGKTTTMNRILNLYPQVIEHTSYKGIPLPMYQITHIVLECPHDGSSLKGLCINFFQKVDEALGTEYSRKFGSRNSSESILMAQMAQITRLHAIGMLVVDEIQHLTNARYVRSERMINFLVTLVNEIGIPVILIGTPRALSILQSKFREARRAMGDQGEVLWDRFTKDESWDVLVEGLCEYNWTEKELLYSDELSEALYNESQGILDIVIKLFMMVQMYAIRNDVKQITPSLIGKVAEKELKLVKPMLDALRSGSLLDISQYEDLNPLDIDKFIATLEPKLELNEKVKLLKEAMKNKNKEKKYEIEEEIVLGLLQLKLTNERDAKRLAGYVVSEYGVDLKPGEAVKLAIKELYTQTQEKTKNRKETKEVMSNSKLHKEGAIEAYTKEKSILP
ncbi:AAA family ATPase [Bacillus cereus]|uniref:ATP-binding protein n=1 Tax=Bacillus cereus TaxID=1396 RepID=UPI000BF8E604|nr:ATP-binding protein [Bacillus cereus]PFR25358.1 AAA family ATPase [Bacillus cereus]